MKGIKVCFILFAVCAAFFINGCGHKAPENKAPENTFVINGSTRELILHPETPPDFPDHPGRDEFVSYCSMCHSLKYITSQPLLPAKTWDAEVTKMITKYKAPIDSVTGKKIAAYIVKIKSA